MTEPLPSAARPLRILSRGALLQATGELRALCQEVRSLHESIWEEDAPDEEALRLLARHRALAAQAAGPFQALAPLGGLLDYVVERLRPQAIAFRVALHGPLLAGRADEGVVALAHEMRTLLPTLDALSARVYGQAQAAPALDGPRMQRMLAPLAALLKAILRQDWADAELVLNHLNMVTTSRDSHEMVEQIGRLVRSIYDSLNEISRSVPIASLSSVSEEIPDAVEKLGSIIAELEAGANRNLDRLEQLTERVNRAGTLLDDARAALAQCDAELAALAERHPAASAALNEERGTLQQRVAAELDGCAARMRESHEVYMTLFANQSYQDLTGQTLKKVIAFIESLQFQLIQVISKQSAPSAIAAPPAAPEHILDAGPDAHNRLSQDKVDSMLAEMGF